MLTGEANLTVTFTDTSTPDDAITYWLWDFGDGSAYYEGQTPPPHLYDTVGVYTVTLHVASAKGIDTFSDTVNVTGLVAYYKMDEAAGVRADSVSGYNLTDVNAVGNDQNAAEFIAASEQYLVNLNTPIPTAGGLTVAFWIKSAAAGLPWFPNVADIVGLVGCFAAWTGFAGQLSAGTLGGAVLTENTALADVGWVFVCVWWDPADGFLRSRVESWGSLTETSAATDQSLGNITGIYVGRGLTLPAQYLSGLVGEMRIYNTVLTTAEQDALFALGNP